MWGQCGGAIRPAEPYEMSPVSIQLLRSLIISSNDWSCKTDINFAPSMWAFQSIIINVGPNDKYQMLPDLNTLGLK